MNMSVAVDERDQAMSRGMSRQSPCEPLSFADVFCDVNSNAGLADLSDRVHSSLPFRPDLHVDVPLQHLRERPHSIEWGVA